MIRLAVLGSTRGTTLTALINAVEQKVLAATINIVISNKADAFILERASNHQIPAAFIDASGLTREAYDEKISHQLLEANIDLVVLIGYMRILSTTFVNTWQEKIINIHPSLLPAFAGKMDLDVHRAVIAASLSETGCTVHYVTPEVDAGPIILQKTCPVLATDTPEALKSRVQVLEGEALIAAIKKIKCKGLNLI